MGDFMHCLLGVSQLHVKGAAELVLADCTHVTNAGGSKKDLDDTTRHAIEQEIKGMADRSLRALCIAHRDFASVEDLPENWKEVSNFVVQRLDRLDSDSC